MNENKIRNLIDETAKNRHICRSKEMTSILLSLPPLQVARILNGDQTIIIQDTAPKRGLPTDAYIYCQNGELLIRYAEPYEKPLYFSDEILRRGAFCKTMQGMVVAKLRLTEVGSLTNEFIDDIANGKYGYILRDLCLTIEELKKYKKRKKSYLWYVSNLQIFQKPKDITEFYEPYECGKLPMPITKAPSSWRYVEAKE